MLGSPFHKIHTARQPTATSADQVTQHADQHGKHIELGETAGRSKPNLERVPSSTEVPKAFFAIGCEPSTRRNGTMSALILEGNFEENGDTHRLKDAAVSRIQVSYFLP